MVTQVSLRSRLRDRALLTRYHMRTFSLRIAYVRPGRLEMAGLVLAVIGAWTVFDQILAAVSRLAPAPVPQVLLVAAVAGSLAATWWHVTRNPQLVFRSASHSAPGAEALRQALRAGMASAEAYDCLHGYYQPFLDHLAAAAPPGVVEIPRDANGRPCLALTVAASSPLSALLDSQAVARTDHWNRYTAEFAQERQAFMATLRRDSLFGNPFGDEEGANLVLDSLVLGPPLRLTAARATYGQIVRTSDSLINEFALFGYLSRTSAFRRRQAPLSLPPRYVPRLLPWRQRVHSWDSGNDLFLAPTGRAAGIGVSVALVDRSTPSPVSFVARRSSRVGTYPDAWHVVPSGMVNARSTARDQVDLADLPRLTMLSEFLEECFDVTELEGHSLANFRARIERELTARGLAAIEPVFTGLTFDLLNLRLEICALMDVTAHHQQVEEFTLSWEYTHNEEMRPVDARSGARAGDRTAFVQSGLGCLHLASRAL